MPPQTRSQTTKQQLADRPSRGARYTNAEYTVTSWNMQGGSADSRKSTTLRKMMDDPHRRVILLQECSDLFDWTQDDLQPGWKIALHERWNAGGGNNRCSLAILTRSLPLKTMRISAARPTQRPLVGVQLSEGIFWNMHAPSQGDLPYIGSALRQVWAKSGDDYFLGGDFNVLPGSVPLPHGSQLVAGGTPTQNGGREIDFGIAGSARQGRRWRAKVNTANTDSDHRPVDFTFDTIMKKLKTK